MGYMGACRTIYKAQEGAQKEIAFRLSLFFLPSPLGCHIISWFTGLSV